MNKPPTSILLKIGENFKFQCDGNLTTGYDWIVNSDTKVVSIDKKIAPNLPDSVGNSNSITFKITGKLIGKTSLIFTYQKPWEKDIVPLDSIRIEVEVEA